MTKSKWTISIIMIKRASSISKDFKNLRMKMKQEKEKESNNKRINKKKKKEKNDMKVIENNTSNIFAKIL